MTKGVAVRRVLKWLLGIVLVLLAIPVIAIMAVLILANTAPGRHLIESETASLTGGMVRIEGLGGRFPDRLKVAKIEVSDAKGPYVTVTDVVLNWSPLQLVHRTAQVQLLAAQRLDVLRLPVSSEKKTTSSSSGFSLPVHVDLKKLEIQQADIAAVVAGAPAVLALTGSAQIQSLQDGSVRIAARRLDKPGTYDVAGTLTPAKIDVSIQAHEPPKGLISSIAELPDLGAINVRAVVDGPKSDLNTQVAIQAGQLTASAAGSVDYDQQSADLTLKAQAPAMKPAPGIFWQSVLIDARVHGSFTRPDATGLVKIDGLSAAGARIGALTANASGNAGHVALTASITGLHVPGPRPDLFAAAPITLTAAAQLDAADRPITFVLHHPLLTLDGSARTEGQESLQAHLVLPDLAPFAAAAGTDLRGHTDLTLAAQSEDGTTSATATGVLAVTGGKAPAPALIGEDCHIDLAASLHGKDVTVSRLTVNGNALTVAAQGSLTGQTLNATYDVALADLATIEPDVSGNVAVKGQATGALTDLGVKADVAADIAAKGYPPGHIDARIFASGLPKAPDATVDASGTLLGSPLSLALAAQETDGALHATISQLAWKSVQGQGDFRLPKGATIPLGTLHVDVGSLADFTPLVHRKVSGKAAIDVVSDPNDARLNVLLQRVSVPGTAAVGKVALNADVSNPDAADPTIDGTLTADGASASTVKGAAARVVVKGPLSALAVNITANVADVQGGPARVSAAGTVNGQARSLALARFDAAWKDQTVRLLAPAGFSFASGVGIEHLRLGYRQAVLAVSGQVGKTLDLTATLRDLPVDVAAVASPSLAANGVIAADVHLTGTATRPDGTIRLTASGVRLRQGLGATLPAANLVAKVTLAGTAARLDTHLTAGPSHLAVTGTVPIAKGGAMNVTAAGRVDLAMANPYLSAQGERATGLIALDATATGTTAEPRLRGTVALQDGSVTDYALGAHITALNALLRASGQTITLARFDGKAGEGTLGGSGTVNLSGAMPVDLRFTANNARPLASDLLTAVLNADLTIQGDVKTALRAGGTVFVKSANIQIPDKLPASVVVLPIHNPNAPPPPPQQQAAPAPEIALDLTINAPQQVFVRGHGLFAEVGGKIHIGGTTTNLLPSGGLKLIRGQFSLVGTTLNFTEGTVSFTGGGISDPSIHFVAQSQTTTMTATLTISGSAKHPQITLSSYPEMPQDEILAQLLFGTTTSKLSPLQLAEIASALAELSGATSGLGNPLAGVQNALGLDRLAIGSDTSGNPTVEGGRYIARGVYAGVKQSASGGGTTATVQVDLYKGLKLEADAGTLANNATGNTSDTTGASVGLTYRFNY